MRFCHGANVAEAVSHVNDAPKGAITITSPPGTKVQKSLPPPPIFAENRSEYVTRHTRWRAAGLPSTRVL